MEDALSRLGEQDEVNIDENQFISLGYLNTLSSLSGSESVVLDALEIPMPDSMLVFPHNQIPSLLPSGSFLVNNGSLIINFLSGHQEDLEVVFRVAEISEGGTAFEETIEVVFPGAIPVIVEQVIDLEDHVIDLNSGQFQLSYSARNADGETRLLGQVSIRFTELGCKRVVTNELEELTFDLPNEGVVLGLFEGQDPGRVNFENPAMSLNINNGYGFPMEFFVGEITAINSFGDSLNLELNIADGFELNFPDASMEGEEVTTVLNFNIDNSNIKELINLAPVEIEFHSFAKTTASNDPNQNFFALAESKISTDLVLDIPVFAAVQQFTIEEREAFNFDRDEITFESDREVVIDEMEFSLHATNNMPVGIEYQIYFEDESEQILDSLFTDQRNFIEAAEVNEEGEVIRNVSTTVTEIVDGAKLERIENASFIKIKNTLTSDDFGAVKFFTTNGIDMDLGVIVKLSVE